MKKNFLSIITILSATCIWSCNNSSSETADNTDSNTTVSPSGTDTINTNNNNTTANINTTPFTKEDSTFIMKAATGGMAEVEMGNLAQQKAVNQRVKDFGTMMVKEHSQANDELKALVSNRGITIPTALPADQQKHMDAMQKMTGKSFDQHYVDMMVNDHKKDINEYHWI